VGGPAALPRLAALRNRNFLFFNWESGRMAQGISSQLKYVRPAAPRPGDFSGLVNALTGRPIVLRDPLHVGIVNNVIPRSALSSKALAFLQFEPLPDTQRGSLNYGTIPSSAVSTTTVRAKAAAADSAFRQTRRGEIRDTT
jgi:hypothetical protein